MPCWMSSCEGQDTNGSSTIIVQDIKQFPECVATVQKRLRFFSWREGSAARMFWMCFRSRQHSEQELEVAVITSYLYTKSNNQRNVKGVVSECRTCLQYTYQGCIYTIYIHPSDLQPTPTRCWLKTAHFHLPQVVRSHNLLANVGFFWRRFKSLKPYKLPDLPLPICR